MPENKKTHTLREDPGMSASRLADYMAASEQGRRTILRLCKFRPIVRLVQHNAAKESIAEYMSSENFEAEILRNKSEALRNTSFGSDFSQEVAEHNADYIDQFLSGGLVLPDKIQDVSVARSMPALLIDGFSLSFRPDLIVSRVNRRNVPKMGAVFFRYSKGNALDPEAANWQGAISFGYLTAKLADGFTNTDPERDLCLTIDIWSAIVYAAPSNSIYRFNEIRAACAGIVERWPKIAPPENAIY